MPLVLDFDYTVDVQEKVLLSGIADSARIIGFSPQLGELAEWTKGERELTKEPEYFSEKDGIVKFRLDVWFCVTYINSEKGLICYNPYNEEQVAKLKKDGLLTDETKPTNVYLKGAYWLSDNDRISKRTGNHERIDVHGNSKFPLETGEYTYINNAEGMWRNAKIGESDVYNLVLTWLGLSSKFDAATGVGPKHDLQFDKLVKGDTTGFNKLAKKYKSKNIQILLGVKNTVKNSYQGVFMKDFVLAGYSISSSQISALMKEAKGQYGFKNHDFMNSRVFQIYNPIANSVSDEGSTPTNSGTTDMSAAQDSVGSVTDGLPF